MDEKRCTVCDQKKPIDQFYVVKKGKQAGYRYPYCIGCKTQKNLDYLRRNPDKMYLRNRRARLKREYGITIEDYDRMRCEQGGVCKLCGKPPLPEYPNLDIDHCHRTGRVRGLLCRQCNIHVGFIENHRQAVEAYLAEPCTSD